MSVRDVASGAAALDRWFGDHDDRVRSGMAARADDYPECAKIDNPLAYPRDVTSKEFAALVDEVHAAITALVLPDEPSEAPAPAGTTSSSAGCSP